MENITTGNGLRVCFNSDIGNQLPQTHNNIEINEINNFPVLTIESDTQEFNTFNSDYKEKLLGNQDTNEMTISVNYIPDDETHKYLDAKLESQDEFQIVLIYSQDDENISYSIVNGVLSGSEITGDKDAVVQKSFNFVPTQLIARSAIAKVLPTLITGDYGVGSNGTTVPQYQPDVPTGNSFIKVPSYSTGNPTGTDLMGIGLVDESATAQLAITKRGNLQVYAKNTDSSWIRLYTSIESDSKYVPKTTTVNGKPLTNNIVLNSADVGSYSKSETDSKYVPLSRTINNKTLTSNIQITPNDIGLGYVLNQPSFSIDESNYLFLNKQTGGNINGNVTVNGTITNSSDMYSTGDFYSRNVVTQNNIYLRKEGARVISFDNGQGNYTDGYISKTLLGSYYIKHTDGPEIEFRRDGYMIVPNIYASEISSTNGVKSESLTSKNLFLNSDERKHIVFSDKNGNQEGYIYKNPHDSIIIQPSVNGLATRFNTDGTLVVSNRLYGYGGFESGDNIILNKSGERHISFRNNGVQDGYIQKIQNEALIIQVRDNQNNIENAFIMQPNGDFRISGQVYATGYQNSSDKRIKKDIKVIDNALEKIEKIHGYTYQKESNLYRSENEKPIYQSEHGFIAQEIKEVLPDAVGEFTTPYSGKLMSIKLGQIDALLCQCIKELSAKVKVLEHANNEPKPTTTTDSKYIELLNRITVLEDIISKMQSKPMPEPDNDEDSDSTDGTDTIEKENDK